MLPKGTLTFHEPLSTLITPQFAQPYKKNVPPEYNRTADPTFMPPQLIQAALQLANQKKFSLHIYCNTQSDDLLRNSVLESSHWSYIVAPTDMLYETFNSGGAPRLAVIHAAQRMCLHVSGSAKSLSRDEPQVNRVCETVFKPSADNNIQDLPEGRTAAGVVLRPATGRFGRRL
ncbi:hypothetical protein BWQ96_10640 [Gracilariopsis chorda]|uniref:Uncharacterized protein n=1 Tax=Gracilariopsis chorda TaxID=448386 RepID=A0A2V3IC46_9FLOR|nr:hypothetical protein BWQ96_10640 [Gracilariopsis chorda]|eukprot:PXF39663.1 hypothetical protein BWQ96_10640 [Gracilariopsis chorda]